MKEELWPFNIQHKEISKKREAQRQQTIHRRKLRVQHKTHLGLKEKLLQKDTVMF